MVTGTYMQEKGIAFNQLPSQAAERKWTMPDPALPGKTIDKPLQADHIVSMDRNSKVYSNFVEGWLIS